MSASFYFDAVGQADKDRWWGGLLALGVHEDNFLIKILQELKNRNHLLLNPKNGELKGKDLSSAEILQAITSLRGHQIYFWGREMPSHLNLEFQQLRVQLLADLAKLQPNRKRDKWQVLVTMQSKLRDYLQDLNAVNSHKFLALLVHPVQLIEQIRKLGIGPRLKEVRVYIDRENFPKADVCAWGLKWFLASQLQYADMPLALTGDAPHEGADYGAVRVQADCDSAALAGLELVDILTHGYLRGLWDFAS